MTTPKAFATKTIYLADAAISGAAALALILLPGPIVQMFGSALPEAIVFWIGIGLLPWAAFNFIIGMAGRLPQAKATANIVGDTLWVLASVAIIAIAFAQFTQVGLILFTAMTAGVAAIALIKLVGLRQIAG